MASKRCLSQALNARIRGSGAETLVLAHGYGMEQSMWDKVVPLLAENYRVVTFDWVCAGSVKNEKLYDPVKYSSYEAFADDLITLLQEMNLKAVTYVGSSMSGIIGCIASVKTPQLFKTLILVGSSPRYLFFISIFDISHLFNFYSLILMVTVSCYSTNELRIFGNSIITSEENMH